MRLFMDRFACFVIEFLVLDCDFLLAVFFSHFFVRFSLIWKLEQKYLSISSFNRFRVASSFSSSRPPLINIPSRIPLISGMIIFHTN